MFFCKTLSLAFDKSVVQQICLMAWMGGFGQNMLNSFTGKNFFQSIINKSSVLEVAIGRRHIVEQHLNMSPFGSVPDKQSGYHHISQN